MATETGGGEITLEQKREDPRGQIQLSILGQWIGLAMGNPLLLTLYLEEAMEGQGVGEGELDAFMAGLVADLNDIEAVSAALASAEETEGGTKALGTFLLGVLSAEVNGENAMKVIRYLRSRLAEQPQPIRLKLSRKGPDGTDVAVEMEGSARDKEAMEALLTRLEACVQKVS